MLESAAEYRLCGASWEVVASHFEMPLAEVMAFIQANRLDFEKRLRFVKLDREYERRARHRNAMRRALRNAQTLSSKREAARAIVSHAMKQEWIWVKQELDAVEQAKREARAVERAARDATKKIVRKKKAVARAEREAARLAKAAAKEARKRRVVSVKPPVARTSRRVRLEHAGRGRARGQYTFSIGVTPPGRIGLGRFDTS